MGKICTLREKMLDSDQETPLQLGYIFNYVENGQSLRFSDFGFCKIICLCEIVKIFVRHNQIRTVVKAVKSDFIQELLQ